jgi:hypothetical protein
VPGGDLEGSGAIMANEVDKVPVFMALTFHFMLERHKMGMSGGRGDI